LASSVKRTYAKDRAWEPEMNNSKNLVLIKGLVAALICAAASAEDTTVLGPVEAIATNGSSVTVLGQTFLVPGSNGSASRLSVGQYVFVSGQKLATGELYAAKVQRSKFSYVPGASEVFLTGVISQADSTTAFVKIGGANVYVAEATLVFAPNLAVGDSVEIAGSQAQPLGPVWATEIRVLKSASTEGIQGTGVSTSGIQGTGISTSGIQGTGASTSGIQGTGVSTSGIQGTGRSTGKQGIQGTGATTSGIQGTGTSTLGIQGTGISTSGIQGTGVSTSGIQGTGISTSGIQGTGISTSGIQGTGVSTSGIQGTGISTSGIQGTGTTTSGIQGTGRQTGSQGIQGTGISTSGIQGTGVSTSGIQGTGVSTSGIQGTGLASS